eukprot:c16592_g1_i1 orf=242-1132(+)
MGGRDVGESLADSSCARKKAAAWAWYARGAGSSKRHFNLEAATVRPVWFLPSSRFKAEAMRQASNKHSCDSGKGDSVSINSSAYLDNLNLNRVSASRDSESSLLDSLELEIISKQLGDGFTASSSKISAARQEVRSSASKMFGSIIPHRHLHKNPKFCMRVSIRPLCDSTETISPKDVHNLYQPRRSPSFDLIRSGCASHHQEDPVACQIKAQTCTRCDEPRHLLPLHKMSKPRRTQAAKVTCSGNLELYEHDETHLHHHHHNDYHYRAHELRPFHFAKAATALSMQVLNLIPTHI